MYRRTLLVAGTQEDRSLLQRLFSDSEVVTARELDLDNVDIDSTSIVICCGPSRLGGLSRPLRARYAGVSGAKFAYVMAARYRERTNEIRSLLDEEGLAGKYILCDAAQGSLVTIAGLVRPSRQHDSAAPAARWPTFAR